MPSTLLNPNDPETFLKCSFYLSSGGCVAFPTETVYGLGANALNKEAVLSIFRFKGRPLSDPLIVHCKDASAAKELVILDDDIVNNENDVDPDQKTTVASAELHQPSASSIAFDKLASSFWPGPLTLVAKAVERIPRLITAETGFVGVRVPKHPVAMALLQACGLPIAAPSANRFGHVSPTSARHVVEDLGQHPIYILEGSGKDVNDVDDNGLFAQHNASSSSSSSSCAVGIESTVAKIEGFDVAVGEEGLVIDEEKKSDVVEEMGERRRLRRQRSVKITILRKGGVSATEIRDALSSLSSQGIHVTVQLASLPSSSSSTPSSSSSSSSTTTSTSSSALDSSLSSKIKPSLESSSIINGDTLTSTTTSTSAVTTTTDTTTDTLHHQAPGMLLSHYAPDIPAFLVTPEIDASQGGGGGGGGGGKGAVATAAPLPEIGSSVIVDFNKRLFHLRESSLAYRDLSQDGSAEEACRVVFETLRWAESVVGATSVLIVDPHHTVKRRGIDSGNDASSSSISSASPGDRLDALRDRLYRAASGKSIQL